MSASAPSSRHRPESEANAGGRDQTRRRHFTPGKACKQPPINGLNPTSVPAGVFGSQPCFAPAVTWPDQRFAFTMTM
jgi:hypothetical protein